MEADENLFHALRDVQDFEDLLFAGEGHVDAGHDGIAERGSVPDGFKRLGSVLVEGPPAGLDIGLKLGGEEVGGRGETLLVAHHVFGRGDHDRGIVAVKGVVRERRPVKSFHNGFHIAVGQVQKLQNLADAAHGKESVAAVDFFLAAVWVTIKMSLGPLAVKADSTARMELSRPTRSGTMACGKMTTSRRGMTGQEMTRLGLDGLKDSADMQTSC